ncbi:hypothetical protein QE152_g37130 [Popillia japonica]|uniref:Uncharacterized protein n=1 Tax=Popillia japonica TaxID=7064 RepID=A0AAW1IB96_POPJA
MSNQNLHLPVVNLNSNKCLIKENAKLEKQVLITNVQKQVEEKEPVKCEEVHTGNNVTVEQKQELTDLLNEFGGCVAKNIFEIGKTDVVEMKIKEYRISRPVSSKPYKANIETRMANGRKQESLRKQLRVMRVQYYW